jgi:tRNA wybutosine-synthesizing protein 1
MIPEKIRDLLKKQHYEIVGKHSAVQICRWTKKSIRNEGVCYKEKFYGIESHRCCQMTPSVMWCENKCLHCWRAIENTIGDKLDSKKVDSPSEIIDKCIQAQRKLLEGFKILPQTSSITKSKANMKKWSEAQEPMQFAISLSGEPTIYPRIGELISELKKRGKTSFLVTNGLNPEKLEELLNKKKFPTQLYISVNSSNKKDYEKFHRSSKKNAWELLQESLSLMKKFPRSVFRINLIRGFNMSEERIKEFAEMIKRYKPMFVELKGFMSVGFARERLGYDKMPDDKEMKIFAEKLAEKTGLNILDFHEFSRAYVLGKDKEKLKIKNGSRKNNINNK